MPGVDNLNLLLDTFGFNKECEECPFFKETVEHHPWGSTTAREVLAECLAQDDDDCLRLRRRKKLENGKVRPGRTRKGRL